MNNLHEALEVCLQEIELGADIETSLLQYPTLAAELRPILETSVHAKRLAAAAPSEEMLQRNRAKLLQRAAVMRAATVKPSSSPVWFASVRRLATVALMLALVFGSGAGLVRASSTTLPGDNLYPVKRTCEDLVLLFTFDLQSRNELEVAHQNERLQEVHELIAIGRSVEVDFAGIVTQQNGNQWLVAGIPVILSAQIDLDDGPVSVGDAVRVFGMTQSDTSVVAERIEPLSESANLPDAGNSGTGSNSGSNSGSGSGSNDNRNDVANENDSSGPGNGNDNSNDNNSGPGSGNDNNSGPGGGNDNQNSNDSGSGGGSDSGTDNSGSGSGDNSGSDNSNEDTSGSGSGNDNGSEDNSGSGGGGDNSNEDNSGSGGGGD